MRGPPPYPPAHDLLAGKVVVVTASAGAGIGSAAARRCLEEGAQVVVSDTHERRLGETLDALKAEHAGAVAAAPCDVTVEDDVQRLIATAVDSFGRLDVMINNAGLGGTASVLDMTDEQWTRVLDVTLNGTFRCTRAALRQFVAQGGGGAIVNNASVIGWRAQKGQTHYAAAKAGVMAHTRCSALEAAEFGHLDVVVNNAGLGGETPVVEMTDEQWSTVLDVTLTGTFRCTRAVLKQMYEQGSGVIVNNASVLGWPSATGTNGGWPSRWSGWPRSVAPNRSRWRAT